MKRFLKELGLLAVSVVCGVIAPYLLGWLLELLGGELGVAEIIADTGKSQTYWFFFVWAANAAMAYSLSTSSKATAFLVLGSLTLYTLVQWVMTPSTPWLIAWVTFFTLSVVEGDQIHKIEQEEKGEC